MAVTSNPSQEIEGGVQAKVLRLGFVPNCDCAPIAVAMEMGLFERYGLDVELSRESDWNGVRDKIYHNELDASQAIPGIAFALGMGFPELRCEVAVPLILNLHGHAITLSNRFTPEQIGSGEGLRSYLNSTMEQAPLTFATTHPFSSHHIMLRQWLLMHGVVPDADARIIFLPAHQMPEQLKAGQIDGYCVGEPWNSKAVLDHQGWCPVTSRDLTSAHTEKVLMIAGQLLSERRSEAIALVAALLDACKRCQDPEFRETLVHILAQPSYTGASPEVLRHDLFEGGCMPTEKRRPFHHFHGESVNRPTIEKASWVLAGLSSIAALPQLTAGSLSRIYREDLYHEALKLSMP